MRKLVKSGRIVLVTDAVESGQKTDERQQALQAWLVGLPLPPGWSFMAWRRFRDTVLSRLMTARLRDMK
jgi:hypothetical protein